MHSWESAGDEEQYRLTNAGVKMFGDEAQATERRREGGTGERPGDNDPGADADAAGPVTKPHPCRGRRS